MSEPIDLDALKALRAQAMPGYWKPKNGPGYPGHRVIAGHAPGEPLGGAELVTCGETWRAADAEWIAAIHNAAPALFDAASELVTVRAALDAARAALAAAHRPPMEEA